MIEIIWLVLFIIAGTIHTVFNFSKFLSLYEAQHILLSQVAPAYALVNTTNVTQTVIFNSILSADNLVVALTNQSILITLFFLALITFCLVMLYFAIDGYNKLRRGQKWKIK